MMKYHRVLIAFAVLTLLVILGCAVTTTTKTESVEDKTRQDSLAAVQRDSLLRLNRMYAYDYLKRNDWETARQYLWKVVELDVDQKYNDWARLYQTYMEMNEADSAQYVITRGLELHPNDPYLNATMGYFLKPQGALEEALGHFQIANNVPEPKVEYLRTQAEIEEALGMGEEAITTYEKVLPMIPDDQNVKDRYTSLLRRYRNPMEYIASLKADADKNPDDLQKRMELIAAYSSVSMNEEVISQADLLLAKDPSHQEAYEMKAKAQENLGRFKETIDTFKAMLKVVPNNYNAMIHIADNYRQLFKYKEARDWIIKAESKGEIPAAKYTLGRVYETCVEKCAAGKTSYEDKLVSLIAYGLYLKAAAGDDYDTREKAESRVNYYKAAEFIPSYSDYFMNQSKKMPKKACYDWIDEQWQEIKYIAVYLDQLAKSKG